ncbi:MAG: hypothetical protein F4X23_05240 [Gemmatimonadales bacterium]|nr:hypothetical protein [Gemmatimonadales bacterium]
MLEREVRLVGREYTVYADESATGERFLGFGALIGSTRAMARAEVVLAEFCDERGLGERSLSWKSCSRRELDGYCDFAAQFDHLNLDFRAMVVDTATYPLKHPPSGAATAEQGFYKFCYFFLRKSLALAVTDPGGFRLVIGATTDQYEFSTEVLETTVAGGLRSEFRVPLELTRVRPSDPRDSRCHQLADVLLGAVTYRFNRTTRDPRGTSHKRGLYAAVRSMVGRDLDIDFLPQECPFNVWGWTPTGHPRWVSKSSGTA